MAKKKSKWKKIAKNVGKAAVLAGALYGASKLGKKGNVSKTAAGENLNIGSTGPQIPDIHSGLKSNPYKFDIDHLTTPSLAAKGGRIGAKGGGIAKRGTGAAFKSGGRVKSMGIAKRGGGAAKR